MKDWEMLKRQARYLVDKPRSRTLFEYQKGVNEITVYTDTDFAGCERTRKSTSGGVIMLGRHMIKAWSNTQTAVSYTHLTLPTKA